MARRNPIKPASPGTLRAFIDPFGEWQRVRGYAEMTIFRNAYNLSRFATFCEDRGVLRPQEATRAVVDRYQKHLYEVRTKKGQPMAIRAQVRELMALRAFFKYLARERFILYNPASEMELPKVPRALPRAILTAKEAETVLAQPDVSTPLGIRDRALLELLYSTGLRRKEISRIKTYEVDLAAGTVFVKEGKGKRDRVVPLGDRACLWMRKYLEDVRPLLVSGIDGSEVFLAARSQPLHTDYIGIAVRRYVNLADIGKRGSCHLFRHTCATLMLENGADVRFVQALLGHSNLSSTEIYTHVTIQKLKEVHARTHPAGIRMKDDASTSSP